MQAFQLDKCLEKKNLDKVIYQLQSSADTAAKNRPIVTKGRDSSAGKSYIFNVDGFAEFLSTQKALGVLLFWKDAEDYRMIFGNEELKGAAKKIHQRYLKQGAEYEVSTIQAAMRTKIEGRLSNPPVDIFEEQQMEMYQVMLLELFPRFCEACANRGEADGTGTSTSNLKADTTLKELFEAQDIEVYRFCEYCRTIMCDDLVVFLLEVGDYRLLFSPADLLHQAKKISTRYLAAQSETRIVVRSEERMRLIHALETPNPMEALPLDLFDKLYDEVFIMLNLETWPKYKEAVLSGKRLPSNSADRLPCTSSEDLDSFWASGTASRKAVAEVLRSPDKLECMRTAAAKQGVKENVDFCVACQQYSLLFSADDRKPKADMIWNTHLAPGCDAPVNLADHMIKFMKPKIDEGETDAFEVGYQEMLLVLCNNTFKQYLKELAKVRDAANRLKAAPEAPAKSGGCCRCLVQ